MQTKQHNNTEGVGFSRFFYVAFRFLEVVVFFADSLYVLVPKSACQDIKHQNIGDFYAAWLLCLIGTQGPPSHRFKHQTQKCFVAGCPWQPCGKIQNDGTHNVSWRSHDMILDDFGAHEWWIIDHICTCTKPFISVCQTHDQQLAWWAAILRPKRHALFQV